jgi:hypothetical protein
MEAVADKQRQKQSQRNLATWSNMQRLFVFRRPKRWIDSSRPLAGCRLSISVFQVVVAAVEPIFWRSYDRTRIEKYIFEGVSHTC